MGTESTDAVVVGSGPNGLAAAVTLARAGLQVLVLEAQETIGGGARTLDLGLAPGIVHDICSAVHPLALASPFFRSFDLAARGVDLIVPEVAYAQPLDGGRAGLAYTRLERTAAQLGPDGAAWQRIFAPLVARWPELAALALGNRPSQLLGDAARAGVPTLAALAARLVEQAGPWWNRTFAGDIAPALLTGVAAHAIGRLPSPVAAGGILLLGGLAHGVGWPVPRGGTGTITEALAADLCAHGGSITTGESISHWRQLPRARAYLMDTSVPGVVDIWGEKMAPAVRAALQRVRPGPGAAKVDFVLSGPIPWAAPGVDAAGTVHVGGSRAEMVAAEAAVLRGRLAERPMVLLNDPAAVDPTREVDGLRPGWAYAHVPQGCDVDPTEMVTAQIERFAPGFRDVVVQARGIPARAMSHHNANYIGGDIALGVLSATSMAIRPRWSLNPYRAGIPGVYICSSAATPGPGVHGMVGWHAARAALADRFGRTKPVDLALSV